MMPIFHECDRVLGEALVDNLLAKGCLLTVAYGDNQFGVERSTDRAAILEALGACDEEHLFAYLPDAEKRVGWFFLVYGNEPGVTIADHVSNDFCNTVWAELEPVMKRLEQ
jgi:hypothetical protein